MTIKNRTTEFQAVVRTIRNRQTPTPPTSLNQRSVKPSFNSTKQSEITKSEFSRQAGAIGNRIRLTADKLQELTKLAKRRTLFDDRPNEINDLTFAIKQDIANINQQLASLQQATRSKTNPGNSSKQQEEHNANVVATLQSQLASASMNFKGVLELRSENMKATKERKEQFTYQPQTYQNNNYSQQGGFVPETSPKKEYLALDLGDTALQQMELVEQQNTFIDTRASAINNIESTIAELGSVFQQLATMVAEQRDVVQRIDANVEDMEVNVAGAQQELLRYFTSISSNRWLIMKVFGLVVMFLVLFAALR